MSAVVTAVRDGDIGVLRSVLEESDVNETDEMNTTALIWACHLGYSAMVLQLLQFRADPSVISEALFLKGTALAEASRRGLKDTVKQLIDLKVDMDACNQNGETALMCAVENAHKDTAQILVGHSASVHAIDWQGETVLNRAIKTGDHELVNILMQAGADVNAIVSLRNKETALFTVVTCHSLHHLVPSLLEWGAEVNAQNVRGETSIMHASYLGFENELDILVSAGGDINLTDSKGRDALVWAAMGVSAHTKVIEFLIINGADISDGHWSWDKCREKFIPCLPSLLLSDTRKIRELGKAFANTQFSESELQPLISSPVGTCVQRCLNTMGVVFCSIRDELSENETQSEAGKAAIEKFLLNVQIGIQACRQIYESLLRIVTGSAPAEQIQKELKNLREEVSKEYIEVRQQELVDGYDHLKFFATLATRIDRRLKAKADTPTEQQAEGFQELYQNACKIESVFVDRISEHLNGIGGFTVLEAGLTSMQKLFENSMFQDKHVLRATPAKALDVLSVTASFRSFDHAKALLERLDSANDVTIVRVLNRFQHQRQAGAFASWADCIINVVLKKEPTIVIGEIRLVHERFREIRERPGINEKHELIRYLSGLLIATGASQGGLQNPSRNSRGSSGAPGLQRHSSGTQLTRKPSNTQLARRTSATQVTRKPSETKLSRDSIGTAETRRHTSSTGRRSSGTPASRRSSGTPASRRSSGTPASRLSTGTQPRAPK